jgi:hypothetical protein
VIHDPSDVPSAAGELFEIADGLSDLLDWHRLRQLARGRAERRIDIAIGGTGGEFLKDWFWLIDFPFYRRRSPNFERLYDMRFRAVAFPRALLSRRLVSHAEEIRPRILARMRDYTMGTNSESYDRMYYEMREPVGTAHSLSINQTYVPFLAPLMDPEVIRLGYSLPRRDRFFNRFHRRLITNASLAAARVPSSDTHVTRMSLSSRLSDELRDAPAYVVDKARRLTAKAGGRFGRKTGYPGIDDPALIPAARSSDAFRLAVGVLVASDVLAPTAQSQLPDRYVGLAMTLGMLFDRLEP